jgi:tetratricopeptide (TPR) repeat protein
MMPHALSQLTDARQALFLALMGLLAVLLYMLERRRVEASTPVGPILQPPRGPAGPLGWDGPADELPDQALFAMAAGDWPAAHRILWAGLGPTPSDWQYYHLGLALQHQGRLAEAEALYRAALEISPDIPEAQYNLGSVMFAMGRWSEAIVAFKQVLKRREDYTDAMVNLGHVYFQLRMTDDALRIWHEAARHEPRAKDLAANLRFVRRLRKTEQARQRLA